MAPPRWAVVRVRTHSPMRLFAGGGSLITAATADCSFLPLFVYRSSLDGYGWFAAWRPSRWDGRSAAAGYDSSTCHTHILPCLSNSLLAY